jgi:hypothetical protein
MTKQCPLSIVYDFSLERQVQGIRRKELGSIALGSSYIALRQMNFAIGEIFSKLIKDTVPGMQTGMDASHSTDSFWSQG